MSKLSEAIVQALKDLRDKHQVMISRGPHSEPVPESTRPYGSRLCEIANELAEKGVLFTKDRLIQMILRLVHENVIRVEQVNKAPNHSSRRNFVPHFILVNQSPALTLKKGSGLQKTLDNARDEVNAWPTYMRQDRPCPCTPMTRALNDIHVWERELQTLLKDQ